jgi:hypothetical protein
MAFLIKFKESPQYRSPIDPENLPEAVLKDIPLPIREIRPQIEEGVGKQCGSLLIHGFKFAGRLSGFLQIWGRDSTTGKAVQQGETIVSIALNELWGKMFMGILGLLRLQYRNRCWARKSVQKRLITQMVVAERRYR